MKKVLIFIIIIAAVLLGAYFWPTISHAPGGENAPLSDDVMVLEAPLPGAAVSSPLTVRGQARGWWFFEASFPVELTDRDGRVIATGIATAQREWMTEDFVPFIAVLEFEIPSRPAGSTGTLTLRKDNPSGLPENDDSRSIPVVF